MDRPRRGGFTMAELMVVLGIIVLLAGVLIPYLQKAFAVQRRIACAHNLEKIGQAYASNIAHGKSKNMFAGHTGIYDWQREFLAHVGDVTEIFVCPEDEDQSAGKEAALGQFFMTVYHSLGDPEGSYDGEISLDEDLSSQFIWRLSETQFQELTNTPGHGKNYNYQGYIPDDDPGRYWFLFEDMMWQNNPDMDFWDILLRIRHVGASIEIYVAHGQTGYHHDLVRGTGSDREMIFRDLKTCVGQTHMVPGAGDTSYAANSVVDRIIPGKSTVLVLDYDRIIAAGSPFDETDERAEQLDELWQPDANDPDAPLSFARHFGKCNVLYADGSVSLIAPETINPNDPDNCQKYWDP